MAKYSVSLNNSIVEDAAHEWFRLRHCYGGQVGELGYATFHRPQATAERNNIRAGYLRRGWIAGPLLNALRRLAPSLQQGSREALF